MAHVQFERLKVDPVRRSGGCEAVFLCFELRAELLRADIPLSLVPLLSRDQPRWSLTSVSSATRPEGAGILQPELRLP